MSDWGLGSGAKEQAGPPAAEQQQPPRRPHTTNGGRAGEALPLGCDGRKASVSSKDGRDAAGFSAGDGGGDGHVVAGARAIMTRYSQRGGGSCGAAPGRGDGQRRQGRPFLGAGGGAAPTVASRV